MSTAKKSNFVSEIPFATKTHQDFLGEMTKSKSRAKNV